MAFLNSLRSAGDTLTNERALTKAKSSAFSIMPRALPPLAVASLFLQMLGGLVSR
jgi:hypothetical protein